MIKYLRTIPIAKRKITRSGQRFFIYLPMELNEIWEHLNKNKAEVDIVIIIPNNGVT